MDSNERRHLDALYARDPLRALGADHYHAGYFESREDDLPTSQRRYLEVLFDGYHPQAHDRVVDVGCGEGNTARWLRATFGVDVVGVDIVATVLERARNRDRLTLAQSDMAEMPFRSQSVDAIVGVESVYHHPDRARVFTEFARVLRPGGMVVLSEYLLGHTPRRLSTRVVSAVVESRSLTDEGVYRTQLQAAGFDQITMIDVGDRTAVGTADFLRSNVALRHSLFRAELGQRRGLVVSKGIYPLLHRLWCTAFRDQRMRQVFMTAYRCGESDRSD
jgi:27-O-demethylrifamycin SV methyltransferase